MADFTHVISLSEPKDNGLPLSPPAGYLAAQAAVARGPLLFSGALSEGQFYSPPESFAGSDNESDEEVTGKKSFSAQVFLCPPLPSPWNGSVLGSPTEGRPWPECKLGTLYWSICPATGCSGPLTCPMPGDSGTAGNRKHAGPGTATWTPHAAGLVSRRVVECVEKEQAWNKESTGPC